MFSPPIPIPPGTEFEQSDFVYGYSRGLEVTEFMATSGGIVTRLQSFGAACHFFDWRFQANWICTRIDAIILVVPEGFDKASWTHYTRSPLTFMEETKKSFPQRNYKGSIKWERKKERKKSRFSNLSCLFHVLIAHSTNSSFCLGLPYSPPWFPKGIHQRANMGY